jgi:chromosome segregation ATPase
MKRLHYVNLLGVLALTALCVAQWRHDRRLNLDINRIEKVRLEQGAKLADQEQTISGLNTDLAQFKDQFIKAQTELNETLQKLRAVERQTNQLALERDQLKASVTNWAAAVAIRDERLKQANGEIQGLAAKLDASIKEQNESLKRLADERNDLVAKLNARTKDFNDVVTKYNTLVKQVEQLQNKGAAK